LIAELISKFQKVLAFTLMRRLLDKSIGVREQIKSTRFIAAT
jgi:hypothetical protein